VGAGGAAVGGVALYVLAYSLLGAAFAAAARDGWARLPRMLAAVVPGREAEVLRLLAAGRTDREIAETLTISLRTVTTHVASILHKLGTTRRAEAARRYRPLD